MNFVILSDERLKVINKIIKKTLVSLWIELVVEQWKCRCRSTFSPGSLRARNNALNLDIYP